MVVTALIGKENANHMRNKMEREKKEKKESKKKMRKREWREKEEENEGRDIGKRKKRGGINKERISTREGMRGSLLWGRKKARTR